MGRRALALLILSGALTGCASVRSLVADGPGDPPVEVPKLTPAQAYDEGVLNVTRGDYAAARRDWNRCLAMTTAESPLREDCLVALEKLANPETLEP